MTIGCNSNSRLGYFESIVHRSVPNSENIIEYLNPINIEAASHSELIQDENYMLEEMRAVPVTQDL